MSTYVLESCRRAWIMYHLLVLACVRVYVFTLQDIFSSQVRSHSVDIHILLYQDYKEFK